MSADDEKIDMDVPGEAGAAAADRPSSGRRGGAVGVDATAAQAGAGKVGPGAEKVEPGAGRRGGWRRLALFCALAATVVVLDQATKAWARAALTPGEPVTLIPGVMDLSLIYNTGAAFSMGEGAGPIYVLFAAAILVAGLWFAWREGDAPVALVAIFGCVAGGGVGNAIDRVVAGQVTDFFCPTFIDFAVFNVADIFITCGVIVGFLLWWRWDEAREAADEDGASGGSD